MSLYWAHSIFTLGWETCRARLPDCPMRSTCDHLTLSSWQLIFLGDLRRQYVCMTISQVKAEVYEKFYALWLAAGRFYFQNRETESHILLLSLRSKEKCHNYCIRCWDDKQREAVEAEDLCLKPDHLNCLWRRIYSEEASNMISTAPSPLSCGRSPL